jgi:hypothetical protein
MKRAAPKQVRREIFVLTPEERRTVCFVLIAFVLGVITKHYRAAPSTITGPGTEMNARASASPLSETKRPRSPR